MRNRRSCPFPCPRPGKRAAAAEARRDPYLDAGRERHRDHLGSAGKGVGLAGGQVAPKPVPTARAPAAGASHHPTTANPSRLAALRRFPSDETDRNSPTGGASRRKRSRGSSGPRRRASWPSVSCRSSFSSPSAGEAWSSGTRSSSTPRTPRRTRSTPSSPPRAGWRSPP